jgi:hypothetical protein
MAPKAPRAARKRRRKRVGAAVAIGLAFTIGAIAFGLGAGFLWGAGSVLAGGALGYGTGWLMGGGPAGTDFDEGSGIGLSSDGDLGDLS